MSAGRKNPSVAAAFGPSADTALQSLASRFEIAEKRCFCESYAICICDHDGNDGFNPPPLDATEECPVVLDGHFAMGPRKVALPRSGRHGALLAHGRTPRGGSLGNDSHDELDVGGQR